MICRTVARASLSLTMPPAWNPAGCMKALSNRPLMCGCIVPSSCVTRKMSFPATGNWSVPGLHDSAVHRHGLSATASANCIGNSSGYAHWNEAGTGSDIGWWITAAGSRFRLRAAAAGRPVPPANVRGQEWPRNRTGDFSRTWHGSSGVNPGIAEPGHGLPGRLIRPGLNTLCLQADVFPGARDAARLPSRSSYSGTASNGQGAWRSTCWVTLPRSASSMPSLPAVAMAIRST